jgi:hypothetical protein
LHAWQNCDQSGKKRPTFTGGRFSQSTATREASRRGRLTS